MLHFYALFHFEFLKLNYSIMLHFFYNYAHHSFHYARVAWTYVYKFITPWLHNAKPLQFGSNNLGAFSTSNNETALDTSPPLEQNEDERPKD